MIQEAIKILVNLLESFPETYKISITDINHIVIHFSDEDFHEKEFSSSVEMLEWLERKYE